MKSGSLRLKVANCKVDTCVIRLHIYVFLLLCFLAYFQSDNHSGKLETSVNNYDALESTA